LTELSLVRESDTTIEGPRVRLSRVRTVSAALLALLLLAACSSANTSAGSLDDVTVGGTFKAPTVTFKTKPLTVKATTTRVITPGKGARLLGSDSVMVSYAIYNGKSGKGISTNFGGEMVPVDLSSSKVMLGLRKGLTGQQAGSRVLVAIPPADAFGAKGNAQAGLSPTDTVLYLVDLGSIRTPLTGAGGIAVTPIAGLPTVTVDGAQAAQITVPKTTAPTKLVVQPLINGQGAIVKSGQTITVRYTGVLWKNGTKFDASSDKGGPVDVQIGAGKVIPGWDKGLVGQTVGSRILLVVPPADGYGAKGSPTMGVTGSPSIGAKDTMVFVIDILAAT
jgi:peptidylprolyl isomerase